MLSVFCYVSGAHLELPEPPHSFPTRRPAELCSGACTADSAGYDRWLSLRRGVDAKAHQLLRDDAAEHHRREVALQRAKQAGPYGERGTRSEEHTSELQSLMRISYDVFSLKKKHNTTIKTQKDKTIHDI